MPSKNTYNVGYLLESHPDSFTRKFSVENLVNYDTTNKKSLIVRNTELKKYLEQIYDCEFKVCWDFIERYNNVGITTCEYKVPKVLTSVKFELPLLKDSRDIYIINQLYSYKDCIEYLRRKFEKQHISVSEIKDNKIKIVWIQ